MKEFLIEMESNGAGEFIINDVSNDGVMNGFDSILFKEINEMISLPFVPVGGGGKLEHYSELFKNSNCYAVGSSSIFSFTRFTPNDIKNELSRINVPVRLI